MHTDRCGNSRAIAIDRNVVRKEEEKKLKYKSLGIEI